MTNMIAKGFGDVTNGFNRTFMELKYVKSKQCSPWNVAVLIVPLWNRNSKEVLQAAGSIRFNRTFMELKCSIKISA